MTRSLSLRVLLIIGVAVIAASAHPASQRGAPPPGAPRPTGSPTTAPGQPQPPVRATGLVIGRVLDADTGAPVAGALVMLAGRTVVPVAPPTPLTPGANVAPAPPPQMFTDGQGRFVFRDLARGPYGLSARASGYLPGSYGQRQINGPSGVLTLDEDARKTDVTIRLWRHASISGAVRDEAGDPVVSVQITLLRSSFSLGRRQLFPAQSTMTDDRGMYRISGLTPGNYYVFLSNTTSSVPMTTIDEYMRPTSGQAAQNARNEMMRELSMAGVQIGGPGLQVGNQQLQQNGQYGRNLLGRRRRPALG